MAKKLALFQMDTKWHDKERNINKVKNAASFAQKGGADVLVLPEMFTTGFSMNAKKLGEDFRSSSSLEALLEIAKENKISIIGSLIEHRGGKHYNTAVAIDRKGKLTSKYSKIHLFPLSSEHKNYSGGKDAVPFRLNGVTCATAICYDLRFPELFRKLVQKGAKLIFVPANWPSSREAHWLSLLKARAIENQCFIAGVNRVGDDITMHYSGKSVVFDAWGEQVALATSSGEELLFAQLDFEKLEKTRKEYPFLKSIRLL